MIESICMETKSQEDTINAARAACGKYDALVFSGGDGTFNNIACGVASGTGAPCSWIHSFRKP